jgi:hypothetical protein
VDRLRGGSEVVERGGGCKAFVLRRFGGVRGHEIEGRRLILGWGLWLEARKRIKNPYGRR